VRCPRRRARSSRAPTTRFALSRLCSEGPEDELVRTEIQQPAILTTSIALLRALEERVPVRPAYAAGHSLGEYTALVASGALALEDAVRLVHARGRFMQEAVPESPRRSRASASRRARPPAASWRPPTTTGPARR
jgi:malonyl CoA-acyl carrier protein transacylase